ncbi:MAG: SH3 domain-containing protein, partial [Lachnospiraceae bacterium]|nr:SH3 domain-containing protein [Lachnospiraceae bacterium]
MRTRKQRAISYIIASFVLALSLELPSQAATRNPALPSAGIDFTLGDNTASLRDLQEVRNQNQTPDVNVSKPSITALPTATPGSNDSNDASTELNIEETSSVNSDKTLREKERELDLRREEEEFKNLVIARVNDYVNVRNKPGEDGEIIGKLYNKSVGNLISEQDGWYEIKSGSVTGFVKGEFCVTGEDAIELAKQVGTRIATV